MITFAALNRIRMETNIKERLNSYEEDIPQWHKPILANQILKTFDIE